MARISAARKQVLLNSLAEGWSITYAAKQAGISPRTVHTWKDRNHASYDPDLAAEIEKAIEQGTDQLEDYAKQRAYDGSDVLTIFLLKGRRPTKYRDNAKIEHSGPGGGPIGVSLSSLAQLAAETDDKPAG